MKKLILCVLLSFQTSFFAQDKGVSISGRIKDEFNKSSLPFVNVVLKRSQDSAFVAGVITNDNGQFVLSAISEGNYFLLISYSGYLTKWEKILVGHLSEYLDLGIIELKANAQLLKDVTVQGKQDEINEKMDKKVFSLEDNLSQNGASVLQSMQNLPGITIQDGKLNLRGSDKVIVLIDGKQTALTGFGNQASLDNIPASAIEKIEIINNPSAKYDANGNAGIINIIYKKNKQEGFNGKVSLTSGLGALFVKQENLPSIRPQFSFTPKLNPSLTLNYKKKNINFFFQGDYLYNQTLNKNEFVTRIYDTGDTIKQQTKRNRTTIFASFKTGLDWNINTNNSFTLSTLFSTEHILDNGDEPFFNGNLNKRLRLWQFLEDELKTTLTSSMAFEHKFKQAGHKFTLGLNYTFHREDEKYFFTNTMPTYVGYDSFKLLSDEHVVDFNLDYIKPLKFGRFEGGMKFRKRIIPTNMQFFPGLNSPLDTNAGGWAKYNETIPALYGNYVIEKEKIELEAGLRLEYVKLRYEVNPEHNTYKSNGYGYTQPFPTFRFAYKLDTKNKISFFYNRRVDRPNEVDIRIFPKYDDAEIIKVGNPALKPQFTNSFELSYKSILNKGNFYASTYNRISNGTISRIASSDSSNLIYSIMQNAKKSFTQGIVLIYSSQISSIFTYNLSVNVYHNQIDAFTVTSLYPSTNTFYVAKQEIYSGNAKVNGILKLKKGLNIQITGIYLAPDIIPQGTISQRFSLDLGIKKMIQKNKGELFLNASDLLGTMNVTKSIQGNNFVYKSTDYLETQVIRFGYSYKF